MAYEEALVGISLNAGADLSAPAKLYTAVKLTSAGVVSCSVAGELGIGILQNNPKVGDPAKVAIGGVSKVKTGAAIAVGVPVATNAAGLLITAVATNKIIGVSLAAAASGDIIPVLVNPPGTGVF